MWITGARTVMVDQEWRARAKGLLKAELRRRGVSYRVLAERLEEMGVQESVQNLANKISRGTFSAIFLLQCFNAIGCKTVAISSD
jgi:hypothetical protein